MPNVTIEGVGVVKFPDTMTPEQITSAIEKDILPLRAQPSRGVSREASDMAAKDMGIGETLLVGAGRATDKLVKGVKQGVLALKGDQQGLDEMKAGETENDQAYAGLQRARPISTGVGEALPYMALPASMGVLPMAGAAGALEATKYGDAGERVQRGVAGAASTAVGGAIGKAVGGMVSPVSKSAQSATHQAALEAAERLGVQPRLSQVTGGPFAARLEDFAARVPGGAGVMAKHQAGNQAAINAGAARSIGETADELSPQVLGAARSRIGQVFEDVKGLPGRPVKVGPELERAADEVLRVANKMLPGQRDPQLVSLAQQAKVWGANKGALDGETYQLLRSGLSQAAFDADGTTKVLYGNLLQALDDSATKSLTSGGNQKLAEALLQARPQYGNLQTLERGLVAEGGNVSPARLAQVMRSKNAGAFREGRVGGDLGDIALLAENMKPLQAGSPTFERSIVSSPVATALTAPFAYGAAKATTSPLATFYPRTVGNTKAAQLAALMANPAARATGIGLTQRVLPAGVPVMAEY